MTNQEVLETVQDKLGSDSQSGCQAYFVKLNEKWGVKLFSDKIERDTAYSRQKSAADVGMAPKVLNELEIPVNTSPLYYPKESQYWGFGYITEIVRTVPDEVLKNSSARYQWDKETRFDREKYVDELFKKIGWFFTDNHPGNWGYMDDGKLVCIDFG